VNKRIFIVAPNWIGDAVLSLHVVDGCAQFWPEADVAVLGRAGVVTLFEAGESAVRIVGYQRGNGAYRIGNLLGLGWRLRREQFNLVLLLPNSLSSAMVAWLAGVPESLGY